MNDYKPNSHRYKEEQGAQSEERIVNKVVTSGTAKVQKKTEMHKLADVFISEDVKNVRSYILMDVLVPTIKKAIVDIVSDGINMIFFGGTGPRKNNTNTSKVSYSGYYNGGQNNHTSSSYRSTSNQNFDYDNISFQSRGEAEAVLDEMVNVIERYGFVTVADLYDIADLTHPYTAAKYGWTSLSTAEVTRGREGYIIKLPKARPIDSLH